MIPKLEKMSEATGYCKCIVGRVVVAEKRQLEGAECPTPTKRYKNSLAKPNPLCEDKKSDSSRYTSFTQEKSIQPEHEDIFLFGSCSGRLGFEYKKMNDKHYVCK